MTVLPANGGSGGTKISDDPYVDEMLMAGVRKKLDKAIARYMSKSESSLYVC